MDKKERFERYSNANMLEHDKKKIEHNLGYRALDNYTEDEVEDEIDLIMRNRTEAEVEAANQYQQSKNK